MKTKLKDLVEIEPVRLESGWKPLTKKSTPTVPLRESYRKEKTFSFKSLKETLNEPAPIPVSVVEEVIQTKEIEEPKIPVYEEPAVVKADTQELKVQTIQEKVLDYISKSVLEEQQNSFQQPSVSSTISTQQDVVKKLRFLEQWLAKVSISGPGGGEVNLAFMQMNIKSVTSSSYNATLSDYYIGVDYAGAVNIYLPANATSGKVLVVKDERGEASKGTNRYITIWPSTPDTIDTKAYAILAYDYGSLTFLYKNGSWRII